MRKRRLVRNRQPRLSRRPALSISEYNQPEYTNIGDKTVVPERIGNTWRATFNKELYEGVRFAFIHVDRAVRPWHITGTRLVCQVKPANYEGSFRSSDPLLDRIWYMSAYSVKLCNLKDYTTPILIERSDRFLWNGLDFYVCNTANLIAFDNRDFVRRQIARVNTSPGINCGIYSFELYDVLNICDYYRSTGDASLVRECMPVATAKLDLRKSDGRPTPITRLPALWAGMSGWAVSSALPRSIAGTTASFASAPGETWAAVMDRLGEMAARDRYQGFAAARIRRSGKDPHGIGSWTFMAAPRPFRPASALPTRSGRWPRANSATA